MMENQIKQNFKVYSSNLSVVLGQSPKPALI